MNRVFAVFALLACLGALAFGSGPAVTSLPARPPAKTVIMPLSQVKPGMQGVAYTVFEGTEPQPMGVQILGVLKDMSGPKGDVILVRLEGKEAEYTGVVAGMSGSPVYVDGKLIGALAYRIGQFSKEPIGGVTPIEQMLEINALDKSIPASAAAHEPPNAVKPARTSSAGGADTIAGVRDYLQPIDTPLVFSGFRQDVVDRFASQFAAAGITPVMGAGSVTGDKQPEPLVPGSAVSMVLVKGDMDIAATCTVTYLDPQRLLACGHPITQYGMVDIPMTKADILATLPSPMNAFKIANATEQVGAFVQDRHNGILGRFGKVPDMIPVTLTVHGDKTKQFKYEVINNAKLTGPIMAATVFNALQGVNDYGDDTTYKVQGKISVDGFPAVTLQNMYAPMDPSTPAGLQLAVAVGERFSRIVDNPYARPDIQGVNLAFDLMPERRWARLETARTDITEARPGDDIIIEALLRPYRGDPIVRQMPVKIPTSVAKGTLNILVSDGDTLDRMRRSMPVLSRKLDLASTIAVLNKEHANNRLYVSLLEATPQAMVEDKVMPTLPLSIINVMDGMRGTQDMVVTGESAVNEASLPLDYVVAGAQVIQVTIK